MTPALCPECAKAGVVATKRGPTCVHQLNHGLLWWPHMWERMSEDERVAWLKKNKERANK